MKSKRIKQFLYSPTCRLAGSYLIIIMLMSIGFSVVFYRASSYQLGRQLPPDSLIRQAAPVPDSDTYLQTQPDNISHREFRSDLDTFLRNRIDEGRSTLRSRLIYLNIGALLVGGALSYYLARRTLRPIEEATEAQIHFVNDAAHELRTPLTAIRASNDVALRNTSLTLKDAKHVIEQNSEDVDRLKTLSDSLLSLAQNDTPAFTYGHVNLQDIVGSAMTQVVPQATAKDITVHDEVAGIHVIGNKAALEQVVVILLDNAVKYSNKKGNVYLKTRQKGKQVYLDVIDEGIGIRSSDLPHLFRRFYRADSARSASERSGYGLGLSIAERIIKSHDGIIMVSSTLGEGSMFSVRLRAAAPTTQSKTKL